MAHVLVIEDERDVADVIEYNLRLDGHVANWAGTAADGLRLAQECKPDVVLLDLMLPDRPGTDVCRMLKESPLTRQIPIIMVSARSDEIDRVVGFELGADDYVTKPFSVRELLLRVRRSLQRHGEPQLPEKPANDGGMIEIDPEAHRVWVEKQEVELSLLEYRLLEALMQHRGRVMTREMLLATVWGHDRSVSLRTIDAHVKRLRDRLGTAGICVETVRGVGYRFTRIVREESAAKRGP
jgi:two-component system, OmpR family, phosphate regulon response regulator PhoB